VWRFSFVSVTTPLELIQKDTSKAEQMCYTNFRVWVAGIFDGVSARFSVYDLSVASSFSKS